MIYLLDMVLCLLISYTTIWQIVFKISPPHMGDFGLPLIYAVLTFVCVYFIIIETSPADYDGASTVDD